MTISCLSTDQEAAQKKFDLVRQSVDTNFTAQISLMERFATAMEMRKKGFILGISSVAGDRGRGSNYIYGASKAAITTYLSGLRNRLNKFGVQVLTVKPGFVSTAMTADLDLYPLLTATPERVAQDIYRAQQKGKTNLYTPWFWQEIMLIIRCIPESIFKRLSL